MKKRFVILLFTFVCCMAFSEEKIFQNFIKVTTVDKENFTNPFYLLSQLNFLKIDSDQNLKNKVTYVIFSDYLPEKKSSLQTITENVAICVFAPFFTHEVQSYYEEFTGEKFKYPFDETPFEKEFQKNYIRK